MTHRKALETWKQSTVFGKIWHLGLLYELSKLKFASGIIKLIASWSNVKFLLQGIHKQACHKVPSCPPHCTAYVYIYIYVCVISPKELMSI
jgi:hypothetical protein